MKNKCRSMSCHLYCFELCCVNEGDNVAVLFRCGCEIENKAGIEINLCYFGLQLILLALFNLIYLGNVYKDPLKSGLKFLISAVVYFVGLAVCEFPVWVYFSMRGKVESGELAGLSGLGKLGLLFTSLDTQYILPQLGIFALGIVIYIISWYLTFRRASRQFESYDM